MIIEQVSIYSFILYRLAREREEEKMLVKIYGQYYVGVSEWKKNKRSK